MRKIGVVLILVASLFIGCTSMNAQRLTTEALTHLEEHQVAEAIALFERALQKDTKNPEYAYNLLYARFKAEEFEDVILLSEAAFLQHPHYLEFLYLKAQAHRALEQTDEAVATYRQIIDLNGGDTHLMTRLLTEAQQSGLEDEAVELAERILTVEPSNKEALKILAEADPQSWYSLVYAYLTKQAR